MKLASSSNPHRAILNVELIIRPTNGDDIAIGDNIPSSKLADYGLKQKRIYKLDGNNLEELLIHLRQILNQLN